MTLGYKILTKQSHQHGLYVENQISFTLQYYTVYVMTLYQYKN